MPGARGASSCLPANPLDIPPPSTGKRELVLQPTTHPTLSLTLIPENIGPGLARHDDILPPIAIHIHNPDL